LLAPVARICSREQAERRALTESCTDTLPGAERVQIGLLRRASTASRFRLVRSLSRTTMELTRRAIRRRRPEADEEEVLVEFVELHYGREIADRLRARGTR
jgi:hypothetical protein